MKKLGLFSLIMACFLYCPVMIMATPHYVSPTGKATWLQSTAIASPCSTAVAFANAQAGDTVYFRGGTYRTPKRNFGDSYSGYYCAAHSGTAASYIVFMAYPSEVPLFSGLTGGSADQTSGSSGVYATIFATNNKSYLVFDGFSFEADTGKKMARMMVGLDHTDANGGGFCTIKNCTFQGGTRSAATNTSTDNNEGLRVEGNNNITVSNCRFTNYKMTSDWHNTSAVKMYWDTSCVFNNCEFDSSSTGVYYKEANPKGIVKNCFFRGNYQAFLISSEIANRSNSDSLQFYNNVVINSSYVGFDWEGSGSDNLTHGDDYLIYNNTFYGNTLHVLLGFSESGHGASFYNNILSGATGDYNFLSQDFSSSWKSNLKQSDHNQWGASWKIIKVGENVRNALYSSLATWQSCGQLENAYDAGGGATKNPGYKDLASNPGFLNGSSKYNQYTDFALALNSPCKIVGRNGADMGANTSLIVLLGHPATAVIEKPSPLNATSSAFMKIGIEKISANAFEFTAHLLNAGDYRLSVFDLSGREVWKRNLHSNALLQRISWNREALANGTYFVSLSQNNQQTFSGFEMVR